MVSDAYRFVLPILAVAALAAFLRFPTVALCLIALAGFVCFFFRNPERAIPSGEGLVVAPADGKVVAIEPEAGGGHRVGIFLSIFDVHVNRSPIRGRLEDVVYKRGAFKPAFASDAASTNEQNVLTIRGTDGSVVVHQIAGIIARRVVCWKKPGQDLERGELFGLIRFGSRVDVLLPADVSIRVTLGDHVKGGSTVLGGKA
ncbi:MAG: phosphatidylserine decarboxylase family protein [Acidobacteria bacterium]|nr:MAG: phosphatidylserine decarboxylase family protein [Acidobacteriota bacterium]